MLTLPDYRNAAQKQVKWAALLFFGAMVLGLLATVTLLLLKTSVHPTNYGGWLLEVLLAFGGMVIAAVWVFISLLYYLKNRKDPNANCPYCWKNLAYVLPLTVASRRCCHCGELVLDDPNEPIEPGHEAPPLPTRHEFNEANKRHQNYIVPVVACGVIGSYLSCCGAAGASQLFRPPFGIIFFAFTILIVPITSVAIFVSVRRGAKKSATLTCFWCGKLMTGNGVLISATRRCYNCGQSAIAPRFRPLPPPHAGKWIAVAEITRREKIRNRLVWLGFGWSGAGLLAVVLLLAMPYLWFGGVQYFIQWLRQFLDVEVARFLAIFGPIFGVVLAFIAIWYFGAKYTGRAMKRCPLDCPRCGKSFLPAFTRATRCCNFCQWPIVASG
jgi:hypothetical protein